MHIKKIELHRFKQFSNETITLKDGLSLVVGGNNSGKSTILQALAAWQFCKTLIEIEKGRDGWLQTTNKSGVGLGIVDFTPLQIPSLAHLWTNLKATKEEEKDGYTRLCSGKALMHGKICHRQHEKLPWTPDHSSGSLKPCPA
jgi:ABC-type uncharacterized transport system ATPase subunit